MIRKARLADVETVARVINERAALGELLPRSQHHIYQTLRDFVVYERESQILGTGAMHVLWRDLGEIRALASMAPEEMMSIAKEIGAPYELVKETAALGRLPVVNFAAGGVATPADAAMMMQLGMDGVFVGSGIFKSGDPAKRAHAIVQAVTHYDNPEILAEVSRGLGEAMVGINVSDIPDPQRLAVRGW